MGIDQVLGGEEAKVKYLFCSCKLSLSPAFNRNCDFRHSEGEQVLLVFKTLKTTNAPAAEHTMSILAAVWTKTLHLPKMPARIWRSLKLVQPISDAAQAYADAVSIPYLITFRRVTPTSAPGSEPAQILDENHNGATSGWYKFMSPGR